MISPLLQDTFGRIAENLLTAFVNDKFKNPYVAATLAPIVSTFVETILTGNSTQTVSTPLETVDPSFWDQATRQYQEVNP
jgi:hypothetical protein